MSLVGLLITMVCIVILMAIMLNSVNFATTGRGSAMQGTVRSVEDQMNLDALYKSVITASYDNRGRFITPSELDRRFDISVNTTGNLYSAMIMDNFIAPRQLISGNEFSGYVEPMQDYDYTKYDPGAGVYWDDRFMADLDDLSHVSFAHQPLYGERFDKQWKNAMTPSVVLFGNRGPKDGIEDPRSFTIGRNEKWGGHHVHGDGSIQFTDSFTPNGVFFSAGSQRYQDNVYAFDDGIDGSDSIITFTREMTSSGPEAQWD